MRRIRSRDTQPELQVRSLVHRLGFRFRLHRADLPGKPDIVFPSLRKVIFVHGCFWHLHGRCREGRIPNSRIDYWEPKLLRNKIRDKATRAELRKLGWSIMVIWECELKDEDKLERRITDFLEN